MMRSGVKKLARRASSDATYGEETKLLLRETRETLEQIRSAGSIMLTVS